MKKIARRIPLALCILVSCILPTYAETRAAPYTPEQLEKMSTYAFEGTVLEIRTTDGTHKKTLPVKASVSKTIKGALAKKEMTFAHKSPGKFVIFEQEFNTPAVRDEGTFYVQDQYGTLVLIGYLKKTAAAAEITTRRIEHKKTGLSAVVVTIATGTNSGFTAVDVPKKIEDDTILKHWKEEYALMFNGGYFERDFSPTGFCRIEGTAIGKTVSEKLSGFVAVDKKGALHLLTKKDDCSDCPTVIQTGPYVIDPGGTIGIRKGAKTEARRTVLGRRKDGTLLVIATDPITLFDLAVALKELFPDLDRALNLDGGVSTALKTGDIEIANDAPVRNYIVKKRPQK